MPLNRQRCRPLLREFRLKDLFVEELGWERHAQSLDLTVDGRTYQLSAIAQKAGLVAFECTGCEDLMGSYATRRKVETQVARSVREHLIIYTDAARTTQIWQWVKREIGRPAACRDHIYRRTQPGDALLQKLDYLVFSLEDEERGVTVVDSAGRVRQGFDVERITRRFYDRFKSEHAAFLKFLKGIPDEDMQRWYVSVMLNRLMFIYFIQKKDFLDGDGDYLRRKLQESKRRGRDRFYRDFLCPLFFDGFAKRESDRSAETNQLLGRVPYLNGGIFLQHEIERQHGDIAIPDSAFERIFDFFDAYQWHLDERPLRRDDEINPDVLGYIFEKYINQKQMGAYYTKEDITGYISQNTVIPHLFDVARRECKVAFHGEGSVWRLLQENPDRYIYEAVRRGVISENGEIVPESALPDFVQVGMRDAKARMFDRPYNLGEAVVPDAEDNNLALPTETWREYVCRRQRCLELRAKLAAGEVTETNDLITYNLDIRQFAQDVIEECEGPELLRAFWHAIESVTVLDPTCGSGAFLFAALNILEPLYEACLQRMEAFVEDLARSGERHSPRKFEDFRKVLARVEQHPNHRYFILKSVVINNLFGVDIMDEAVEICKLRLFLKLVAQIESLEHLEPLPDIDFNIRAGNTLVGYARLEDIRRGQRTLDFEDVLAQVELKADEVGELFALFRQQQTESGGEVTAADKDALRAALKPLEDELNRYLAGEYGVDLRRKKGYEDWRKSHKPFHWFVEFHGIMTRGGFDVIIGNPPYIVYAEGKTGYGLDLTRFATRDSKNTYAFVFERSLTLGQRSASVGLIVQMTVMSSERMASLQDLIASRGSLFALSFPRRPESMFDGVEMPVTIALSRPTPPERFITSRVGRFYTEERNDALSVVQLVPHDIRLNASRIAKIGGAPQVSLCQRVASHRSPLSTLFARSSERVLYYQEACRYWVKAIQGKPFFERNGVRMDPPHGRFIGLRDEQSCCFAACLMNSSLFFWFYSSFADCEHINDEFVRGFPIPTTWSETDWSGLWAELAASLTRHARRKTINTKEGHRIEYDETKALRSKSVIDKVDYSLAKHYGFTDEELDFIINYDIKYRMGRDAEETSQGVSS